MSGDGDKPFEPTPSRMAKAKRDGNVVRAQEFGGNISFLAASIATALAVGPIGAMMRVALRSAAIRGRAPVAEVVPILAWALAPLCSAGLLGGFAAVVQSGGLRLNGIAAKLERLAPGPGLARMFSGEAVSHGLRALGGVSIAIPIALPSMRELFELSTRESNPVELSTATWNVATHIVSAFCLVGLFFATIEFWIARREWRKKLRMTFDEFKRELKEHDGDPAVRARRRAAHRGLLRGPISRVKDAAFVVANPTHVAVAVAYRPPDVPVPVVLVRAADEVAQRVRELARSHGVPIVENVPLARALYAGAKSGEAIPPEHYIAVAEVVGALLRAGLLA